MSFCQPRMYADDTHITYASADLHSMQSSLNRDLSNIHKWLLCNKLTLNSTKTEFMLIGSRQKLSTLSESLELSIDNIPIKQVSTTKSLGILIDNNMAWHSHIDKLSTKIASGIGAIKQITPLQRLPRLEPKAGLFERFAELYRTLGIPTTSNHYSLKTVLNLRSRRVLWKAFQEQVSTARLGRKVHMNELVGQK